MDLYILKNCDICRKAVKWFEEKNISVNIIDIRADGIEKQTISDAVSCLGWEKVLNRRSTSWRNLDDNQKADIDVEKATALITQNPTLMKRPLITSKDNFITGFDKASIESLKTLIA